MPHSGELAILNKMSTSPYNPEPPRKNLIVNLIVKLLRFKGETGNVTPHLFGGDDISKMQYEYDSAHTFFESLEKYVDMSVLDGKEVLDAGCGWGGKMVYYAEKSSLKTISGFDIPSIFKPEVPKEFARRRNISNCFFKTGYGEKMPYGDNQFDVVIMEDVLEHVSNPDKVISECYRVLKPGGIHIQKFPSFRMMYAHHLDRILPYPGLHYVLGMKTWAAGLNYLLLKPKNRLFYEPFDEIVATRYSKSITKNLNGLYFNRFEELITRSDFETTVLEMVPFRVKGSTKKFVRMNYSLAYKIDIFREFLADFVLFIGKKLCY